MKEIFYKKVGRRYVPVSEYDPVMLDGFPKGTHLVMCYPGGESRRYNVDPNHAALIAAGRIAEDAMVNAIVKATALRPQKTRLTARQKNAWDNLAKELRSMPKNAISIDENGFKHYIVSENSKVQSLNKRYGV